MAETTTKERPINLKAWEVKALMDGRLSQLRRVIKCNCNSIHIDRLLGDWGLSLPPHRWDGNTGTIGWRWKGDRKPEINDWVEAWQTHVDDHASGPVACPFKIGERLWVRETFVTGYEVDEGCLVMADSDGEEIDETVYFRATDPFLTWMDDDGGMTAKVPWKSPVLMPRWASRITLEITGLGVERIQDVSEEDAVAMGSRLPVTNFSFRRQASFTERGVISQIWDHDNGPGAWDRNEWTWVIGVRRLEDRHG